MILSEPNEPPSVRTVGVQIVCIQELSSATATNIPAIRNRQVIGSSPIVGSTPIPFRGKQLVHSSTWRDRLFWCHLDALQNSHAAFLGGA